MEHAAPTTPVSPSNPESDSGLEPDTPTEELPKPPEVVEPLTDLVVRALIKFDFMPPDTNVANLILQVKRVLSCVVLSDTSQMPLTMTIVSADENARLAEICGVLRRDEQGQRVLSARTGRAIVFYQGGSRLSVVKVLPTGHIWGMSYPLVSAVREQSGEVLFDVADHAGYSLGKYHGKMERTFGAIRFLIPYSFDQEDPDRSSETPRSKRPHFENDHYGVSDFTRLRAWGVEVDPIEIVRPQRRPAA